MLRRRAPSMNTKVLLSTKRPATRTKPKRMLRPGVRMKMTMTAAMIPMTGIMQVTVTLLALTRKSDHILRNGRGRMRTWTMPQVRHPDAGEALASIDAFDVTDLKIELISSFGMQRKRRDSNSGVSHDDN